MHKSKLLTPAQAASLLGVSKPFEYALLLSIVATAIEDQARHRSLLQQVHIGLSTMGLLRRAEYAFRTPTECRSLAACLSNAFPDPASVSMGLLELFINAIEHGNLGIGYEEKGRLQASGQWQAEIDKRLQDPRWRGREVRVRVERLSNGIQIQVTDEGQGFDWKQFLDIDPKRLSHTHGRGIALAKGISFDSLEYPGHGNQVTVTVNLAEDH